MQVVQVEDAKVESHDEVPEMDESFNLKEFC